MARHYGIITDFDVPNRERALIDISTEGPVNARFAVCTGGAPSYTNVQASPGGAQFVSSATSDTPNLYAKSAGKAAIVIAETCDGSAPPGLVDTYSQAILRQLSAGLSFMEMPRESQGAGTNFSFPLGEIFQGAWLFLGAIDRDTTVNLSYGADPPVAINVDAFTVVKQPLTTPKSKVTLVSFARGGAPGNIGGVAAAPARVVALLAVRTGVIDETYLLPVA